VGARDIGEARRTSHRARDAGIVGATLLAVAAVWSLGVGQQHVAPATVLAAIFDHDRNDVAHIIVHTVRVPRLVLGVVVGGALAVSGALMQTLTRNPLAEPGILGVTAGASFAVVLVTWWSVAGGQITVLVAACIGALVASIVVYAVGRVDPLRLALAGMAVSALLAGVSVGIRLLDSEAFDRYRYWSVGSLAGREQQPLAIPLIAILATLIVTLLLVRALSAIELGDDVAHGLGVPVATVRTAVLVAATTLAGLSTAIAGPIAFAGLIVPHISRRLAGGSLAGLLALCLVFGPLLMVTADTVGRLLLPTGDVPVAVVTSLIGGPVLVWVVRRHGADLGDDQ
jgi:iron complex transport system permease protein